LQKDSYLARRIPGAGGTATGLATENPIIFHGVLHVSGQREHSWFNGAPLNQWIHESLRNTSDEHSSGKPVFVLLKNDVGIDAGNIQHHV
jgi:hypothetical protein